MTIQKYTQKWVVAALLEDIPEGTEFPASNFPLHITITGVCAVDWDSRTIASNLEVLLKDQLPFSVKAIDEAYFGPNHDIRVTEMEKTPQLLDLHQKVYDMLIAAGAVFNDPDYQGEGFRPHCTYQQQGHLDTGASVTIDNITLIDLFPHEDGTMRKITKIYKFKS